MLLIWRDSGRRSRRDENQLFVSKQTRRGDWVARVAIKRSFALFCEFAAASIIIPQAHHSGFASAFSYWMQGYPQRGAERTYHRFVTSTPLGGLNLRRSRFSLSAAHVSVYGIGVKQPLLCLLLSASAAQDGLVYIRKYKYCVSKLAPKLSLRRSYAGVSLLILFGQLINNMQKAAAL